MNLRQAEKIMSRYATLRGNGSGYWLRRWNTYMLGGAFVTSRQNGDHRIRKAITVYERAKRKYLRKDK